ncbi:MAG: phosphoglycerate kinase [Candidatus Comchoanobacterales bacterium]
MPHILIRVDFNVPIENGIVVDDQRIQAALPTIQTYLTDNNSVMLVTHLGRPKNFDPALSVKPIQKHLSHLLNRSVELASDWPKPKTYQPGRLYLAENVRFLEGETKNDTDLAQKMAQGVDLFVNEAFAVAHRQHASNFGIQTYLHDDKCVLGALYQKECQRIGQVFNHSKKTKIAIVGGSKMDTKMGFLRHLLNQVDILILGGGIANTCLKAKGYEIGISIYDADHIALANELLDEAKKHQKTIVLPHDVCVARPNTLENTVTKLVENVQADEAIYDLGPSSVKTILSLIDDASEVLWNGPVGWFERTEFSNGTLSIAKALDITSASVLVGGGDSLRALAMINAKEISMPDGHSKPDIFKYASTGGGAFLYLLEHGAFPEPQRLSIGGVS